MAENFYHYQKGLLTESDLLAVLQNHRQRGNKPQAVIVRPDSGIDIKTVEGLPVEVSDKMKPKGHFAVVI